MFDHIQKILNEVKNFFELADGIGMSVKCFKAHSRLKLTRTHIVTPL